MSPQERVLDERGRPCPLPVIALGRARRSLQAGDVLRLIADDAVVLTDVPAWCSMVGARILAQESDGPTHTFVIRLG